MQSSGAYSNSVGPIVAIKEDLVIVGDSAYKDKAAIFLYGYDSLLNSWKQLNGVIRNDDCNNWFGYSLAIAQDHDHGVMVGCPKEKERAGSLYYSVQSEHVNNTQYILEKSRVLLDRRMIGLEPMFK